MRKILLAVGILFLCMLEVVTPSAKEKKNAGSYWSESNAPVIYGATSINIPMGTLTDFSASDSRFRAFAKDFEDGDLTDKLKVSGESSVNLNKAGTYYLDYSVTDSHNNTTKLRVPVKVTGQTADQKITVERTLYTLPSDWNMRIAGFSRCNTGDRQILGIYMPAGSTARVRSIDADVNFSIQFINNDLQTACSYTVKSDGSWVEIKNTVDGTDYDAVPLITSIIQGNSREPSPLDQINKTYKIELEYDMTVPELNYYHYKDNEEEFRTTWKRSGNSYGIVENEVLTMVVPLYDEEKMTNYYKNGFVSLDQHLEYYKKAIDQMDAYVGLSFNPEKLTDQNIRTKYLILANIHGWGAAYYIGNHVGIHSKSMASFFEMNWGGLHEIGHGYQGNLGSGAMSLGEVGNNILAYYIQSDKSIYFHSGNWLGEMSKVEASNNQKRENGESWGNEDLVNRLYMIVNLFNNFEGGETYGKMFSWYREKVAYGESMTNQDAYVEALADIYGVNIIPYMEAWGLKISDDLQDEIYERDLPMVSILNDMVSDKSLSKIMDGEGLTEKYSLVENTVYKKYKVTGNATIKIKIDNQKLVNGKMVQIQQNGTAVKSVKISNGEAVIKDLTVGTYYIQMPVVEGYSQGHLYIQVKDESSSYTYTYTSNGERDYNNYLCLKLQGIFNTYGYVLTFKENYTKATITLGQARMSSSAAWVKIYNDKGALVSEENVVLNDGQNFNFKKGTNGSYDIDIKPGYEVEVYHPHSDKVRIYSTMSGEVQSEYNPTSATTKYIVTKTGLRKESMSEEEQQELQYQVLKKNMVAIIEAYKQTVTEKELSNKHTNFRKKSEVLSAYNQLRAADQATYKTLITKIRQGGSPVLKAASNLSFTKGASIKMYTLVTATDNEDGIITLNSSNTTLSAQPDADKPGTYPVSYQVKDSDGNTSKLTVNIKIADIPSSGEAEVPTEEPEPDEDPADETTASGSSVSEPSTSEPSVSEEPANKEPSSQTPSTQTPSSQTPASDNTTNESGAVSGNETENTTKYPTQYIPPAQISTDTQTNDSTADTSKESETTGSVVSDCKANWSKPEILGEGEKIDTKPAAKKTVTRGTLIKKETASGSRTAKTSGSSRTAASGNVAGTKTGTASEPESKTKESSGTKSDTDKDKKESVSKSEEPDEATGQNDSDEETETAVTEKNEKQETVYNVRKALVAALGAHILGMLLILGQWIIKP